MKKILIIEDDQVVANVYRNKLAVDGYKVEIAPDGEAGLKIMRTFQPHLFILDLMLPTISGVEVIREIRAEADFAKTPIIVFSNTYLTNLIQDAWRAGASKCLSKSNCSPKDFVEVVRLTVGESGAMTPGAPANPAASMAAAPASAKLSASDAQFEADLRKVFVDGLPATLYTLRLGLQGLIKAENEMIRLKHIHELYRRVHALNGNAGLAGLTIIAQMAAAFEALLKELYEKPKNLNASTTRTVAAAVDFLGILFDRGTHPEKQELPPSRILVVDDEAISRRAITYALDKANLKSIGEDDPNKALDLLSQGDFDLVFLDVDMPEMSGFELCAKLRAMPHLKKTPVVFVTSLNDFDNRTNSMMAGGNDFIGKPFLFIELSVKALIYVMRARVQPAAPVVR
jgi:DNA-binding response OmpR family regulator